MLGLILISLVMACFAKASDGRVLLFKLGMDESIDPIQQSAIQDLIASGIARRGYEVLTDRDVSKMLEYEETKIRCGSEVSCLAEIGAALGVPEIVSGSLARLGESWLLSIQRIDARHARVAGRCSRRIQGDMDSVLDAVPHALTELYGPSAQSNPTPASAVERGPDLPTNPYKLWGHISFWSGLCMTGIGGVLVGMAASARSDAESASSAVAMRAARNDMERYNGLAIGGFAMGGGLLVTGLVLWLLSPGDETWAREHSLALAPQLGADLTGLQLGLRF